MVFGRRNKPIEVEIDEITDEDVDNFVDDLDEESRAAEDAELLRELERESLGELQEQRPEGPWDVADAPATDPERLDLGSLRVPVLPDTDVRLEVNPEGEVVAVTLVSGDSALQLNAFAAPRKEGIWDDVRSEIGQALAEGGGQAAEAEGRFGVELRAAVPTETPDQGVVLTPARFIGVDGPRWFLRGLLTGPGAQDDAQAAPLLAAFRDVAVDRGDEAMIVRESLPLRLPPDALQAAADAEAEAEAEGDAPSFSMPERGPEITEIR